MTWRRPEPPPKTPPQSVLLLRAIGDLQAENDGNPLDDLDAISAAAGFDSVELPALIAAGVRAGYLEEDREGAISLTGKGQRWYRWDTERRG